MLQEEFYEEADIFAAMLAAVMVMALLAGCGSQKDAESKHPVKPHQKHKKRIPKLK